MEFERTLAIIKPDAVAENVIGKILAMLEASGLRIIAAKMVHLSNTDAETFYSEYQGQPFYRPLIDFMISGPVMLCVIEGKGAIQALRKLMGGTNPAEAESGTIRHLYANHTFNGKVYENAIHGSDSATNAEREINFFFNGDDFCPRTR